MWDNGVGMALGPLRPTLLTPCLRRAARLMGARTPGAPHSVRVRLVTVGCTRMMAYGHCAVAPPRA